jgi:hypothetical protein
MIVVSADPLFLRLPLGSSRYGQPGPSCCSASLAFPFETEALDRGWEQSITATTNS